MGKYIEEKYSNINQKVIKRHRKLSENVKHDVPFVKIKRKLQQYCKENDLEPKKIKLDVKIEESNTVSTKNVQNIVEEFVKLRIKGVENVSDNSVRLQVKNLENDLFFADELNANYESFTRKDFVYHIFDEIALEGLDGITLETLFKRLEIALKAPLVINNNTKSIIWQIIRKNTNIKLYELPTPREKLQIFDISNNFNHETGIIMEFNAILPDIYKPEVVTNEKERGSCATYHTRTNRSDLCCLNYEEIVKNYGTKLVFVADQKLRQNAIYDDSSDPNFELQPLEFALLERIGRSRELGELTQGPTSITNTFRMDSKSFFHYKKHMDANFLLSRQFFYVKSTVTDQNKTGGLIHLRRFFSKRKTKDLIVAEQIVELLKKKPNFRMKYAELKEIFKDQLQNLRILKMPEIQKYIKVDLFVSYRDLHPNAKKSEWICKNSTKERTVRLIELKNPFVNIAATWKEPTAVEEASDDEDVNDNFVGSRSMNVESFKEVYQYIFAKGTQGSTLTEILGEFQFDVFAVRAILRKLVSRNVVDVKKTDKGKQRKILYTAKNLDAPRVVCAIESQKTSSVLERLKLKQKEKLENVPKDRIYTKEQFEVENLLKERLDLVPLRLEIPKITCVFIIRDVDVCEQRNFDYFIKTYFSEVKQPFKINLYFKPLKHDSKFDFTLVNENFETKNQNNLQNFNFFYENKFKPDFFTKLFLLRALFGEIEINSEEVLDVLGNSRTVAVKRKRTDENPEENPIGAKIPSNSNSKLDFMGENPQKVFECSDGDVTTEIVMSTPPERYVSERETYVDSTKTMTDRVISRINIILNVLNKEVFGDIYRIGKIIEEREKNEGYENKIDRKSLARIYRVLVIEGYIKIYKVVVRNSKITKTQTFVCLPNTDHTHTRIQSFCEQEKWRLYAGDINKSTFMSSAKIEPNTNNVANKKHNSPFREDDIVASISELKALNKMKILALQAKHNRLIGKSYGYAPKFIKTRIIHEFLFYLVYDNPNKQRLSTDDVRELFKNHHISLTDDDLKNMPPIYCNEISWKMFIPPLPEHLGWGVGWALVCDVILRMPLSVLVKIHNVSYVLPELSEILRHPIKRFYLLRNQPEIVRNVVLYNRKYIFNIYENLCRMAYCGLLQFGPEKYKEKDQIFVYVNRRASLLETMTSEPSYHKVTDKEYKTINFYFESQTDLDDYWYNLYQISMNTRLNERNIMGGKTITIVDISAKPSLVKALSSKTPEEAAKLDDGHIPGDKRGAAGLDSSLWVHITRNWFWASRSKKNELAVVGLKKDKFEKISPKILSFGELNTTNTGSVKVYLPKKTKDVKHQKPGTTRPAPLKTSKSVQSISRKIMPKMSRKTRRQYFDSLDNAILKKNGRIVRVTWTDEEDKVLLLCKAASMLISPRNTRKQLIPYHVIRDILHRVLPHVSKNKTSRACQRRLKLYKEDTFFNLIENNVSNLLKLDAVSTHYSHLISYINNETDCEGKEFKMNESQLTAMFVFLMSYLVPNRKQAEMLLQGNMATLDHFSDANLKYSEENIAEIEEEVKYSDVKNEDDVRKDVLKSVIHSSLSSMKNRPGSAYQLFKIYQKFPDSVIRNTVTELKKQQLISFKKLINKKEKKSIKNFHTPFQLSNYYVYSQSSTFNETTAIEAYNAFQALKTNTKPENFLVFTQDVLNNKRYGQMLGMNEVTSYWLDKMTFKLHLPENPVILDPQIEDYSQLIDELALRYQIKLKKTHEENMTSKCDTTTVNCQNVDNELPKDGDTPGNVSLPTIDSLKSWITDCIEAGRERSPSPEFRTVEEHEIQENLVENKEKHEENAVENIPTLKQIKQEMMEKGNTESRKVPYITDLSDLLSENFNDVNTDDATLDKLKSYFVPQFPYLEDVILENRKEFNDFYLVEYLENSLRGQNVWETIKRHQIIGKPWELDEVFDRIRKEGGDNNDVNLTNQIVNFVVTKELYGATGKEIKENFDQFDAVLSLDCILKILVETNVFLQAGVCTVSFVHYRFRSTWLIETFTLSTDEEKLLENSNSDDVKDVKDNIDKRLKIPSQFLMVKIMPWTKIDGTLNVDVLKDWLCNVLSYCLENPKITMVNLCEKFCYLKPVDLFYLIQILEELGCLSVYTQESVADLCSSWDETFMRPATFLDDFDTMFVETNNVSMTFMGSFLVHLNK